MKYGNKLFAQQVCPLLLCCEKHLKYRLLLCFYVRAWKADFTFYTFSLTRTKLDVTIISNTINNIISANLNDMDKNKNEKSEFNAHI